MSRLDETEAWRTWPAPALGTSLHEWQAGRCAWCGYEDRLVKDHCHETGLVRGLLCHACNSHEGFSVDDSWESWRKGGNAAATAGHFEIYVNTMSQTTLSPMSALTYYTKAELETYWSDLLANLAAGGEWPISAPWTDFATARRDSDLQAASVAMDGRGRWSA